MIHQRLLSPLYNALSGDPYSNLGALQPDLQPVYVFDDLRRSLGKRNGPRVMIYSTLPAQGAATFVCFEIAFVGGAWLRKVLTNLNGLFVTLPTQATLVTTNNPFSVEFLIDLPEVLPQNTPLDPTFYGSRGVNPASVPAYIQRFNTGSVPAAPSGCLLVGNTPFLGQGEEPLWIAPGQLVFISCNTANTAMNVLLDFDLVHVQGITA